MKAKLKVLENNTRIKEFIFRSSSDATRFLKFANIYLDESGCGNGYSAYWPYCFYVPGSRFLPFSSGIYIESKPWPCLFSRKSDGNKLNMDFVQSMLLRVLQVRSITNEPSQVSFKWKLENKDDGIVFELDNFPAVQRPQVGDMYRIPRRCLDKNFEALRYSEGRVLRDNGYILEVLPCRFKSADDPEAKIFSIEAERTIKINDWLKYLRS